ncbi:hypothetical protein KX928_05930 [Roseobacter sp. YSTF-M11]|uniref:Uncharacterized protein n=1 Tax=Roseobacter insulae TaxID=2859783 RepID=A0A9X1FTM9_9RHOB|nr:hypothetical protein [Roseobacter insulae]MBW4707321.1 hypothetical protein [Roseobacter insulae]
MAQMQDVDRDVAAIRAMIAEENTAPAAMPRPKRGSVDAEQISRKDLAPAPTAERRKSIAASVVSLLIVRILRYRPNTKVILGTSFVLMALLQPVFVLGVVLVTLIAVMITYVVLGAETFWRRFLSAFQLYARWFPATARKLRIHGELAARKWDRLLERLPDRLADSLRAPDLRAMARADKRHAEAMVDRLNRLHDETAT